VAESVTHVAGPVVHINGRIIQRCPWCGEKLCDSEGVMMPVGPDGKAQEFHTFPEGHLIAVSRDGPTTRYLTGAHFVIVETLPSDFCLSLVE
jgi:hypothetical protein